MITPGARMKMGTTLLLAAALVLAPACGGGGSDEGGGGPPTLAASFFPDNGSPSASTMAMAEGAKSGDSVTVRINLTDTNNVFGAAFEVTFDETKATFLGFTQGTALETGGNTPNYTVDGAAQAGRVVVGVSRTGPTPTNVSGTKPVINLTFRVKEVGTFPIAFENGVVTDSQPTPQPLPGIGWFAGALQGV